MGAGTAVGRGVSANGAEAEPDEVGLVFEEGSSQVGWSMRAGGSAASLTRPSLQRLWTLKASRPTLPLTALPPVTTSRIPRIDRTNYTFTMAVNMCTVDHDSEDAHCPRPQAQQKALRSASPQANDAPPCRFSGASQ